MELKAQRNRWSCLLTAMSMVLDVDEELLISELGHDGSAIIFENLPEPYCRRSFHIQEFVYLCYYRNIALIGIEPCPVGGVDPSKNLKKIELKLVFWKVSINISQSKRADICLCSPPIWKFYIIIIKYEKN